MKSSIIKRIDQWVFRVLCGFAVCFILLMGIVYTQSACACAGHANATISSQAGKIDLSDDINTQTTSINNVSNSKEHPKQSNFALINKKMKELDKSGHSHEECKRELIEYIRTLPKVKYVEEGTGGIYVEVKGEPFIFFKTKAFGEIVFCEK